MSDTLQGELRQLFAKAKMPSSPALAARILELAENPDSTVDEFADLIQMDPALAARLLSMTNSAAYAQRQKVTTIQRAVTLLGTSRVRTVSLSFQLVGHLGRLGGCQFDMKQFWQHSLLRACIGREFAESVLPAYAEEIFLVGLLQDCGILLLVQLLGEPYAELCRVDNLSPTAFFETEKHNHQYNHVEMMTAMAREWRLPEIIISLVEKHHTEPPLTSSPSEEDRLWALSYLVGSVSLTQIAYVGDAEPALAQLATRHLSMNADAVQDALKRAAATYEEMGRLLKGIVPDDLDVTDLLSQANTHLTMSIESERDQSSQEQERLKGALGEYRERAARDPLTGLLNRGALNDAIQHAIQNAMLQNEAMAVLFLDVDNFKKLNDTFGHQAGDDVLRGVAITLKECVSNAGTAGRYGGEEFLIAVTGLSEPDARAFAETVLTRIRNTSFPGIDLPGPVTCSMGGVWGVLGRNMTSERIIQAADELMYQAKRSGKDRCCFRTLKDIYNIDLLESDGATIDACAGAIPTRATPPNDKSTLLEEFKRIATKLDRETPQQFLSLRKSERKQLYAPCTTTAFVGATLKCESDTGFVRNISTGGVGILVPRSMLRGQPVEVAIPSKNNTTLYVAGIVAFCRHAEGSIFEIGLQLFTNSKQPILSADPISAIRKLDWVAQAMQTLQRDEPVAV